MIGRQIVFELNGRLVALYDEFRQNGIEMSEYMAMLASHASALTSVQDDPEHCAVAFCDNVMRGTIIGIAERSRMRRSKPL